MVTEIPHTDPAADAAMDRTVQIAPTRRTPSLDELRHTAAKIRRITAPEVDDRPTPYPEEKRGRSPGPAGPVRYRPDDRPTPYPEIRPPKNTQLAITDRPRSLPPVLPPPSAPAPAVPLPTNGPNTDYKQLRDASEASHKSQGSAAPSYRSHRTHGSPSKYQLALIEPSKPGSRPPSRPQSILRAPSVEEGRTPSQSLGPSERSSRSASHVSSAVRSASAVSQNSVESGQFGRSHSVASKVSQRSSRSFRERSPWRHAPNNDVLPILNPRPTRERSVASSVGRASVTSSDFAQGKTTDKRRRIGSGTPRRSMSASLGPARRSASTIYREIHNRD